MQPLLCHSDALCSRVTDAALPTGTTAAELRRAALWMLGAIVSFSAMAVAGRSVSIELDTFELMFYR